MAYLWFHKLGKIRERKERVDGRGIFTNNAVPSRTRCQIYRVFPYCGNFLKSKWAQRFYELCCQYKNNNNGYFGKTIDQLRQMFMLEDKYKLLTDFKAKVINKAQKELKEAYDKGQCDVWFDYFQKGKGADARFDFIIHTKESDIKQTELWENMKTQTIYIVKVLQLTYKTDPKFVKRVTNELQINPDLLHPMFDKITKLQKDFKGGEFAKLLRWVLKEDFKIQ